MSFRASIPLLLLGIVLFFSGCATTPPYVYRYIPGRTATVENGIAIAPPRAPRIVKDAIAAGNDLVGKPYRYGGGHRTYYDDAYDCSGAVSYVLHAIGRLNTPTPSKEFRHYGDSGEGRWISLYASSGHSFLVVAGLRYDTGWGDADHGPRWLTRGRPADDFLIRHPGGL
jgi:hypothetical protein